MKAVGYRRCLPIDDPEALIDFDAPSPKPRPRDLLVHVRAISVNPVDTRIRRTVPPADGEIKVLGWDAAGVVQAVGHEVTLFKPGDEVYYAGSNVRPGANSELHIVDERIVGRKPANIDFAPAAAMPLTTITAWELLFDRLEVAKRKGPREQSLLVVGAAGGVGSMLVQLARRLTLLTVIATASRRESAKWVQSLGAHHVIDHSRPLRPQLESLGLADVTYVASLNKTHTHYVELVDLLQPEGRLGLIDDTPEPLDVRLLKPKCISLHYEAMFMRSKLELPSMLEQHALLCRVAGLVETGTLRSTQSEHFGRVNAENLRRAHAAVESGATIGKIVLEGF